MYLLILTVLNAICASGQPRARCLSGSVAPSRRRLLMRMPGFEAKTEKVFFVRGAMPTFVQVVIVLLVVVIYK